MMNSISVASSYLNAIRMVKTGSKKICGKWRLMFRWADDRFLLSAGAATGRKDRPQTAMVFYEKALCVKQKSGFF